ncbi:hypothetical protein LY76DRAFT_339103 [Colletotrichum caudatum]|nr:hypothetical protein LY76DRAFT_339103 [Colletotrichum caudatum]
MQYGSLILDYALASAQIYLYLPCSLTLAGSLREHRRLLHCAYGRGRAMRMSKGRSCNATLADPVLLPGLHRLLGGFVIPCFFFSIAPASVIGLHYRSLAWPIYPSY